MLKSNENKKKLQNYKGLKVSYRSKGDHRVVANTEPSHDRSIHCRLNVKSIIHCNQIVTG